MRLVLFLLKVGIGVAAATLYLTLGWLPGLLAIAVWLFGLLLMARRTARAYEDFLRCPRNHLVPQFSVARCGACGAVSEGSVWECPHCGALHGFVRCEVCGLAVTNPMFGRS